MHIIYFLLIGLVVGWLAGMIVKGRGFGVAGNIVVGVIGSLIGGFLSGTFGIQPITSVGAMFMALIGAVIFLVIVKLVRRV